MHAPRAAGGVSDMAATAAVVAESHHITKRKKISEIFETRDDFTLHRKRRPPA
jgi:hypothetical protein